MRRTLMSRLRWLVVVGAAALVLGIGVWLVLSDSAVYRFVVRLHEDQALFKDMLSRWGLLAPIVFIVIQALQVVMSPIPGEVTGLLGGFAFGLWPGFFYSIAGLTAGSILAFWIGRWLGARFVRRWMSQRLWNQVGFIVEAEGAILCFIIYLIPGFPKDVVCFLFGISPISFWIFAVASTLGRVPGTWALAAQGAKAATGHYVEVILIAALAAAVAMPLYYYRARVVSWFRGRPRQGGRAPETADGGPTERVQD